MDIGGKLDRPCIIHGTYSSEKLKKDVFYAGYGLGDIASLYYAPTHDMDVAYDTWWDTSESGSEYFPYKLNSTNDARRKINDFIFPIDLKNKAMSESRKLMHLLLEDKKPRIARNQVEGRFNPMSSGRLLTAVRGGTYDVNKVRPFNKIIRDKPDRPHVGIVSAGNWAKMWGDRNYIPNIGILTMAVSWACETLGCLTTSVIARRVDKEYDYRERVGLVYLSKPDLITPLQSYCAVLHKEMYRVGMSVVTAYAHVDNIKIIKKNQDITKYLHPQDRGVYVERADEKFHGIDFIKSQGATLTISIGEFDDSDKADIILGNDINLTKAIDTIAEQLIKQKYKLTA